jgi:hypothetical protein
MIHGKRSYMQSFRTIGEARTWEAHDILPAARREGTHAVHPDLIPVDYRQKESFDRLCALQTRSIPSARLPPLAEHLVEGDAGDCHTVERQR